jgi:hypothetical protein
MTPLAGLFGGMLACRLRAARRGRTGGRGAFARIEPAVEGRPHRASARLRSAQRGHRSWSVIP